MDQTLEIAKKKIRKANDDDARNGVTLVYSPADQGIVVKLVKGMLADKGILHLVKPIPLSILIARAMKEWRNNAYRNEAERETSVRFIMGVEIEALPCYVKTPQKQYRRNEKLAQANYEIRRAETDALRSKFRSQAEQQRNEAERLNSLAIKMAQRGQFEQAFKFRRQSEECIKTAQQLQSKADINRIETALSMPTPKSETPNMGVQPLNTGKYTSLVAIPSGLTLPQQSAVNAYVTSIGATVVTMGDDKEYVHVPCAYQSSAVKMAVDKVIGKEVKRKATKAIADKGSFIPIRQGSNHGDTLLQRLFASPVYKRANQRNRDERQRMYTLQQRVIRRSKQLLCGHNHRGEHTCYDCGRMFSAQPLYTPSMKEIAKADEKNILRLQRKKR